MALKNPADGLIGYPDEREIRWLLAQGVSDTAMLKPTPIRAGNVRFLDGATFDFDAGAARALIFTEERDLVAWSPRTGQLASWRGVAFALGEEAVFNPASWFVGFGLHAYRLPLDWLCAGREGIVIVRPRLTYAMLRHVPRLIVEDVELGRQLRRWLRPPKSTAEILVKVSAAARAAA